jgi:hypothetical protein
VRLDQEEQRPTTEAVQGFVADVEDRLPAGAEVFQLPVIPYPEYKKTYGRVFDYEGLLPYLWSRDLEWSYGVHRGRPEADWQRNVDSADPAETLAGLRGLGFDGIVVDSYQYDDGGTAAVGSLEQALGPPEVTAGDGPRWRFWDLRGYGERAGLDEAQLRDAAEGLAGDLVDELPAPAR